MRTQTDRILSVSQKTNQGNAMTKGLNVDEVLALPASVDLATAGKCFGLGRATCYQLAGVGEFPVPVHRLGKQWRVMRADILTALGIAEPAGVSRAEPSQIAS
jgi:hypothetical protein